MTPKPGSRFFFVHVMKTGGTSFSELVRENFREFERYPDVVLPPESDIIRRMEAYSFASRLIEDVNAHPRLRMVRGHVPYAVRSLLNADYTAMTILRHPVERTLSYLNHCRRFHREHANTPVEEIYEQPWFYETFVHNYQTKLFSMTADEAVAETRFGDLAPPLPLRRTFAANKALAPEARKLLNDSPARFTLELFSPATGVIDADNTRLARARRALKEVDLVGVTEGYEKFLARLRDQHGWRIGSVPHRNSGETPKVSSEFRKRIAEDNTLDMSLYDLACSLAI